MLMPACFFTVVPAACFGKMLVEKMVKRIGTKGKNTSLKINVKFKCRPKIKLSRQGTMSTLNNPTQTANVHQSRSVLGPCACQHVFAVPVYRILGNKKLVGNFFGTFPLGHKFENVFLPV